MRSQSEKALTNQSDYITTKLNWTKLVKTITSIKRTQSFISISIIIIITSVYYYYRISNNNIIIATEVIVEGNNIITLAFTP